MKVYTANEMRVRSDYLEGALADKKTAAMLRQAAEAVVKVGYGTFIADLRSAVEREKAKPVRNFNKYETAKDAFVGFTKFCDNLLCGECRFRDKADDVSCAIAWLYEEAEKEDA